MIIGKQTFNLPHFEIANEIPIFVKTNTITK